MYICNLMEVLAQADKIVVKIAAEPGDVPNLAAPGLHMSKQDAELLHFILGRHLDETNKREAEFRALAKRELV